MSRALFLPSRLVARGASVRLVSGWEARTAKATLDPKFLVCHHTASVPWSSAASNLSVCVHGNGVAPGPISQTLVQRDGSIDVVAAGSANHAGAGSYPDGTSGNGRSYGIEAVNSGIIFTWNPVTGKATWGGNSYTLTTASNELMKQRADRGEIVQTATSGNWYEPWGEKQLLGYAANVLAYLDEYPAWDLGEVLTHQSYAPNRKIDPSGPWFDAPTTNLTAPQWMTRFKALVAYLDHPPAPPTPPTGGLMFTILPITDKSCVLGGNMDAHGVAAQVEWLNPARYAAIMATNPPIKPLVSTDLINCTLLGPVPPGLTRAHFANVIP